jgi:hypothetical protein
MNRAEAGVVLISTQGTGLCKYLIISNQSSDFRSWHMICHVPQVEQTSIL